MHRELNSINWFLITARFRAKNTLNTYLYSVIEAVTKDIANVLDYHGDIIYHIEKTPFSAKLRKDETFQASILLPLIPPEHALLWRDALETYFQDPWNARNVELLHLEAPLFRDYQTLLNYRSNIEPHQDEICLDFLTPLSFNPKHPKKRTHIDLIDLIELMQARIERLFGQRLSLSINLRDCILLPYWSYHEYPVNSASQPASTRYINGCAGKLYIKGKLSQLLPLLILCEELHCGPSLSYGRGYYILRDSATSFIDRQNLRQTLRFYLEKNRDQSGDHFEDTLTELQTAFLSAQYQPKPAQAFIPDGINILTEKLDWKDHILHSLIYKLLKNPIDNILPLTVFSFRPHLSERDLQERVNQLINSGFDQVALLSFEGLYKRVDHDKLLTHLENLIPTADHFIIKLIEKFLKAGYYLDGTYHQLRRGLFLGSPLSSMLTNVYLLPVDRALNTDDTHALRHGNSILILANSGQALQRAIDKADTLLSELGYTLDRNSIKYLTDDSITFAGVKIEKKQKSERLRKPLFITKDGLHLSLQSETLRISNILGTEETIPLSRISQLIICTDTTLTSPLLRKLVTANIPVVVSSDFKSPVIIARRDYKSYYDNIFKHTLTYNSLTQEQILVYAKEIALLKIKSYELFYAHKRHPNRDSLIKKMRQARLRIAEARDIDKVRGHEAYASKENYQALNVLMKNPAFHIKVRQREAQDYINSLINLLSHLIFNKLRTLFHSLGLNPYLGFLHSPDNPYESLCADIHELLRARVDGVILNLVNLRILSEKDFKHENNSLRINSKAVQRVIEYLEEQMNLILTPYGHTLYDFIYIQSDRIKRWATTGEELKFEIPW